MTCSEDEEKNCCPLLSNMFNSILGSNKIVTIIDDQNVIQKFRNSEKQIIKILVLGPGS